MRGNEWHFDDVGNRAIAFEAEFRRRGTMAKLKLADPTLAGELIEQLKLWNEARVRGTRQEIEAHSVVLLRGFELADKAIG